MKAGEDFPSAAFIGLAEWVEIRRGVGALRAPPLDFFGHRAGSVAPGRFRPIQSRHGM